MPSRILDYPVFDADRAFRHGGYVVPSPDDFKKMAELCGIDRIIFGSDWPHPEGLADPINLVGDLEQQGLDDAGIRKVMGGNLVDLFKVPAKKVYRPDLPALVIA